MKTLLVMSPMFKHKTHYLASTDNEFPIGLCYIASVLQKSGRKVRILDGQLSKNVEKELANLIENYDFDVIGFSAVTPSASNTSRLAAITKKIRNRVITIVGGVHPTVIGEGVLNQMPAVDIAVFGEAEETILDLLEHLENKKPLENVRGIAFRKENRIIRTSARPLIKDIDAIALPAHHLVDILRYTPPPGLFLKKPIIGMISSRGCPYDCNFCADTVIWQGKCRLRTARSVLDEMRLLAEKYGTKEIKFFDDTFTVNRSRAVEICNEILKRRLDVLWRCASRVDKVDPELLKLMKKSGCSSISFGIESGSDEILKKMNKKATVDDAKNAVRWSKEAGIETKGFFMLNYPEDTVETTEKTIRLSKELDLDFVGFNMVVPYHGTKLRQEVEKNYRVEPDLWNSLDMPIGNYIYFYQDALPVEYLKSSYKRAALGFYLRPKFLLKSLFKIRNFEMFKSYILGFSRLFGLRIINKKEKNTKKCEEYILQKNLMKPSLLGRLGIRKITLIPVKLFFNGLRVLDIGCGNGIFLKTYKNAVGSDMNRYMVEECLRQGFRAEIGSLDDLSAFADESFEGVFLSHVLEHVKEPKLNEVYRVLKSKGKLVVEVPINKAGFESNPLHVHRFTSEELEDLVRGSRFKIKKSDYILPFFKEYIHNHYRVYAVKK